jgi:hypothetical protein
MKLNYEFLAPEIHSATGLIVPELAVGSKTEIMEDGWVFYREECVLHGNTFRTGQNVGSLHIDNSFYEYVEIYSSHTGPTFAVGLMEIDLDRMKKFGDYKMQADVARALLHFDDNVAFAKYTILAGLTNWFKKGWMEDAAGLNGISKKHLFDNFEGLGIVTKIELELLDPTPDEHTARGRVVDLLHKSTPRKVTAESTRTFGKRYFDKDLVDAA